MSLTCNVCRHNKSVFYISTFRSMCALPSMSVLSSSFISCFPGTLLRYFLNDSGSTCPYCYWYHICFYIPRCDSLIFLQHIVRFCNSDVYRLCVIGYFICENYISVGYKRWLCLLKYYGSDTIHNYLFTVHSQECICSMVKSYS